MKYSTLFRGVFATAISASLLIPVMARQGTKMDPDAKTVTIEGAVRDLACPVQNPAATATNFDLKCTRDCVRHGSPIIILTKDGFIYFPISPDMPDSSQRAKMMPFVGKYVQATGAVFERKGTHAIAITQIKELKTVHLDATRAD
jgi:DNA/RNA endonuclease YhcR with UshA esterase domain